MGGADKGFCSWQPSGNQELYLLLWRFWLCNAPYPMTHLLYNCQGQMPICHKTIQTFPAEAHGNNFSLGSHIVTDDPNPKRHSITFKNQQIGIFSIYVPGDSGFVAYWSNTHILLCTPHNRHTDNLEPTEMSPTDKHPANVPGYIHYTGK